MSALQLFPPEKDIHASLQLGGSKSISNRLLILRQVLQGNFSISNLSDSEDTQLLERVLHDVRLGQKTNFYVHHAGTDLRFLTAYLATQNNKTYTINGSERLKERPIAELANALQQLGAEIQYLEKKDFPPLKITGKQLQGGKIQVRADISSQFISALLLISPLLPNGLDLILQGNRVSEPYINMSLELLRTFGLQCDDFGNHIRVQPYRDNKNHYPDVCVESDWSSASYWYSVCALSRRSKIQLQSFNSNSMQGDAQLSELFANLGVKTVFDKAHLVLTQTAVHIKEFNADLLSCPDIAPTIACTCLGLGIPARLTGLTTLQFKESKRIDVLKTELEKFGAIVTRSDNHLQLIPPAQKPESHIRISTHNDHRIAMSFAPLSLVYPGLEIDSPQVVDKSYPRFWSDLQSLGFRLNLQS